MNKRARTLARLKISRACKDNPDLPRKLVFSLLISEYQASVAIPRGQAWFWSKTWQQGEKEALCEIEKSEDAYWAEKAEEGVNSGFLGQSETRNFIEEKLTLDQAMAITFAQNSEVKKHYDEMEEEYKIKAQNIEEATHKGNKRRRSM